VSLLPVLDLLFGFLLCDPVFLLDLAKENVAFTGDLIEFIISMIGALLPRVRLGAAGSHHAAPALLIPLPLISISATPLPRGSN
jgi:hypothetical protein